MSKKKRFAQLRDADLVSRAKAIQAGMTGNPVYQLHNERGTVPMEILFEILRSLGRIEGEFVEIRKLSERVAKLIALAVSLAKSLENHAEGRRGLPGAHRRSTGSQPDPRRRTGMTPLLSEEGWPRHPKNAAKQP